MPFRRLLNVAYAALAFGKDDDELADFDRDLTAEPESSPSRRPSRQEQATTSGLMASFALAGGGG